MQGRFLHETLARGEEAMARLGAARVFVCGAGAVGSLLVDNLVRQGLQQVVIVDGDRVEERNVNTQIYTLEDIGAPKVEVLQAHVFRTVGVEIEVHFKRLRQENIAGLIRGVDLVVDAFDNHASRRLVTDHCKDRAIPCLHVGLQADYCEVLWNEEYRVPKDAVEGDACDYPLARNLILFAVALASEAVVRFLVQGVREGHSFTLADFSVNPEGTLPPEKR